MFDYIRRGHSVDHKWYRVNKVVLGDERVPTTLVLRVVRAAVLYADGQIYLKWVLNLGQEQLAGSLFTQAKQFSAPVGTNQQDEAMDQFIETMSAALVKGVKVLVARVA